MISYSSTDNFFLTLVISVILKCQKILNIFQSFFKIESKYEYKTQDGYRIIKYILKQDPLENCRVKLHSVAIS